MATFRLTAEGVNPSCRAAAEKLPLSALRTKDFDPRTYMAGRIKLDVPAARAAIRDQIGAPAVQVRG